MTAKHTSGDRPTLIGRVACAVGWHNIIRRVKWTPSITAKVVTDYEEKFVCRRCGKVLSYTHFRWNGEDMVDVSPNA